MSHVARPDMWEKCGLYIVIGSASESLSGSGSVFKKSIANPDADSDPDISRIGAIFGTVSRNPCQPAE
jgi:hypothetical protein